MYHNFMNINVLLLIYITSADFHLNSLNTANKSLDTFNQSKIRLNNTGDYNEAKNYDPIIQQYNSKGNENVLLNTTTTITITTTTRTMATTSATKTTIKKRVSKYLPNRKPSKMINIVQQQQQQQQQLQEPNYAHRNANHFYNFLTTVKFNNRNNQHNHENFNLSNKLKAITAQPKYDDDREKQQNFKNFKENPATGLLLEKEKKQNKTGYNYEEKYPRKYYAAANSFSNDGLGQLPQLQLQAQQLQQIFLQQQVLRQPSTSTSAVAAAAASLLPLEYHHLTDYRLLYNAERHTQFYLYTLTSRNDFVTVATKQAATRTASLASFEQPDAHNSYENGYHYNYSYNKDNDAADNDDDDDDDDDDDEFHYTRINDDTRPMVNLTNGRILNVIADTIRAVFGVNARPVPALQGIHIEEVELYNGLSLRQSRFNPFNPCRILIHGWLGGSNAGIYNTVVPEYLKLQRGAYNIFTVDWGKGAIADYITASYRVKPVGVIVAKFIDFLHQESGIPFEKIHLVGFSMGAHVAGIAGKYVQTGRLPVIYGLDPALPLFRYDNTNERLDARDANYVEVIHTSVGSYGYDHPLGHVDFYINFGYNQPGCFFNECSHFRAFKVYGQSLWNEVLEGVECAAVLWWDMIKRKRCSREMGRSLRMGVEGLQSHELSLRRGLYYVRTNAQPPYRMQ